MLHPPAQDSPEIFWAGAAAKTAA
uniref:Uncharacterized protein n=1 Tax=Arundo donax TaxID=35708 RepID=A0A0A8YUB5_ARUDO